MGGLALSCLGFSFAESLHSSVIFRILMGIFAAPGLVGAFYVIDQRFLKRYFSFLVGITEMCTVLGTAVGQTILAQGVIHIGWRHTLMIYSIMGLIAAILGFAFLRERKQKAPLNIFAKIKKIFIRPKVYYTSPSDSLIRKGTFKQNLKLLLKLPDLWIASLISGLAFAILSAFAGFWCIPFLQNNFQFSLSQAALASASIFAGAAICTPFMGMVTDKLKNKITTLIIWVFVIITLLFFPLIFIPGLPLGLIYALLIIIGMLSSVYVIPFALAKRMAPPGVSATAMGLVNVLSILIGAPILQPLIGGVIHATNSFILGLSLFPLLTIIAAILSLQLKKNIQRQPIF